MEDALEMNPTLSQEFRHAVTALEAKDGYTGRHAKRVAKIAGAIALAMQLSREEQSEAQLAGLLHDIGKIWVADAILQKGGSLSDSEWDQMRRHPKFGWSMLIGAQGDSWRRIAKGLLLHHERPDGRGYPFGLKGDEIPLLAQIIAVADTFDAMTSDRPYRKSLGEKAAYDEILRHRSTQFFEKVVDAFVIAFRMGKLGEARLELLLEADGKEGVW
jgi:HD-GYP domain-containing protein (c-di-GMP phosphodiesterase class II)